MFNIFRSPTAVQSLRYLSISQLTPLARTLAHTTPSRLNHTQSAKHVVIVGGGLVGLSALTTLSKLHQKGKPSDLQITLVDPKAFVEVRWAAIRALFDSSIANSSIVSYSSILPSHPCATHIPARAVSVDTSAHTVTLDTPDSTPLSYDVLLCSTGSETSQKILTPQAVAKDAESRRAELSAYGTELMKASSILVMGGGAIGVELAGDVKAYAARNGN